MKIRIEATKELEESLKMEARKAIGSNLVKEINTRHAAEISKASNAEALNIWNSAIISSMSFESGAGDTNRMASAYLVRGNREGLKTAKDIGLEAHKSTSRWRGNQSAKRNFELFLKRPILDSSSVFKTMCGAKVGTKNKVDDMVIFSMTIESNIEKIISSASGAIPYWKAYYNLHKPYAAVQEYSSGVNGIGSRAINKIIDNVSGWASKKTSEKSVGKEVSRTLGLRAKGKTSEQNKAEEKIYRQNKLEKQRSQEKAADMAARRLAKKEKEGKSLKKAIDETVNKGNSGVTTTIIGGLNNNMTPKQRLEYIRYLAERKRKGL